MDKAPQKKPTRRWLRSITHLMIGGVEVGLSQLLSSLESWDQELDVGEMASQRLPRAVEEQEPTVPGEEMSLSAQSMEMGGEAEGDDGIGRKVGAEESPLLRHALIGLFYVAQDGLLQGIETFDRTTRTFSQLSEPFFRPIQRSKLLRPLRNKMDEFAERGEDEIMSWVRRGQQETEQGRKLVQTAISSTVEHNVESLATNPELHELVQKQSTGLANEILEELRERTVSADYFLEGVARSLLRKTPRQQLPEPPRAVIESAVSARPRQQRLKS